MATSSSKPVATKKLTNQEIQATFNRFQNELQTLAQKIGELESEAEEHELVLATLNEALQRQPDRICFRLVGGVLVERTVKDVVPALKTNRDGIKQVLTNLIGQYKGKEGEFNAFTGEYNIKAVPGR
ncbi:Prefoldin [Cantharellus anzutake]|uniref:Prefoldin n=1 Tax=Cantharellus anzutake TaxID=1750568 RepID=UPI0019079879|nr:Prefoldin [Cantharellus anzutake]KAF8338737.1 Prefoldin [Cantharellus anzutake]